MELLARFSQVASAAKRGISCFIRKTNGADQFFAELLGTVF